MSDKPEGKPRDGRFSDGMIGIIGNEVVHDGEAEHYGDTPRTEAPPREPDDLDDADPV